MSTDLLSLTEIARLAGVNRSAVSNWRERYVDFPKPVSMPDSGPLYDRSEVKAWLANRRPDALRPRAIPAAENFQDKVDFIWAVADLLRGDYKPHDYGQVILPLTVLRRMDCVLDRTKDAVLAAAVGLTPEAAEVVLPRITGVPFYNTSSLDFKKLLADPNHIAAGLRSYVSAFSSEARATFESFKFEDHIEYLDKQELLYLLIQKFAAIDLHPDVVANTEMGSIFEELIRKFSEQSNETAGEHFTPRDVVKLMVDLLVTDDTDLLTKGSIVKTILDPACGTGGMLSVADERLFKLNQEATLVPFGEELNPETWAICSADLMMKGSQGKIVQGNSFSQDGFAGERYDYFLCNPPYGVEWKKVERTVREEAARLGFAGRFGAGLPRINDGSFLFLQHMRAKWKEAEDGGSRMAIIFNGSPLFTGGPGSGESEIRRWVIDNDWLEAIVGLPDQLFYNTGISTYIWILTNRKRPERRGKVQLINATRMFTKRPKSLGSKRNFISDAQIDEIVRLHGDFQESKLSKILDNEDFGYRQITVERPLRVRYEATDDALERFLAAKPVLALTAGDDEMREKLTEAFRAAGLAGTTQRKVAEKSVAAAVAGLDGLRPKIAKEMLKALTVRDERAPVVMGKSGPEPDPDMRDTEDVPLKEDVQAYFEREVRPYAADAWIDEGRTKIGYEIPFTRHFYEYVPPRPLEEIDAEIWQLESEISALLVEGRA
ncbi:MAG: N-6 DNA methylase [Candidatus Dormibacteraceae bacterium]